MVSSWHPSGHSVASLTFFWVTSATITGHQAHVQAQNQIFIVHLGKSGIEGAQDNT